ncbi:hypothetical protein BDQ17DRAFT_1369374 [Cyathus striatus]|nr:hypothetical protein BDQ17DRAFT_1369374 [Cyathus striatus]
MYEGYRPETVMNAIVAGQLKATTVPLRDDDNDDSETIHTVPPPPIEKSPTNTPSFGGFGDFDLDLSCLSLSSVLPPPRTPSPPPSPILSRSVSVVRQLRPLTKMPSKRQSSPLLPPMASLSLTRGTWPSDFTGRGTPIDRTRRSEWGGILGEEIVGEDGVLLSSTAIGSFDSPKPTSHRSVSPDWNYVPSTTSAPASLLGAQKASGAPDEVPELAPIEIKGLESDRPDEWDSIMEAVLRPADIISGEGSRSRVLGEVEEEKKEEDSKDEVNGIATPAPVGAAAAATTVVAISESSEPVLDLQAGLDAALDMGLGLSGGRNGTGNGNGDSATSALSAPSDHRDSTTSASGKLEGNGGRSSRLGGKVGWRKMFGRMCRLSSALHLQKGKH